jgi:hypothetical protein
MVLLSLVPMFTILTPRALASEPVFFGPATPAPATSLVGCWKFDEGTGTVAADSSGNGNNGALENGPAWTNGIYGKALRFDGTAAFVNVPDSSSLHFSNVTVEAWIYLPIGANYSNPGKIVSKAASNGGTNLDLGIWNDSDYVDFGVGTDGGANAPIITSNRTIPRDAWTFVAGTYDGSLMKIYINSILDTAYSFTGGMDTNDGRPLTIGKNSFYPWSNEFWLNATIDEVRVYNTALSPQEIQADMGESLIFQDDFKSYAVGSFPSLGGWQLVYNGAGDQYQVITSDYSASGSQSLQMEGQYGWSAVVAKDFASSSNLIGFEAYLMGTPGSWPSVGFGNEAIQPWGRIYGAVGVDTIDGYIVAGGQNLSQCTANAWYKIREVMDRNAKTYNVSVNDVLEGINIPEPNNPWEIQSLRFDVGWSNVLSYYDDVKVFEYPSSFSISSVSPIVATRLQTIRISGTGFGDVLPQTVSLGDGSVETVKSNTTPSMAIFDNGTGSNSWIAGFTDNSTIFSIIGLILVSWSDTEIVLGGFGNSLGINGQGTYNIAVGDPLQIDVYTSANSVSINILVVSQAPDPFTISLSSPVAQVSVGNPDIVELTVNKRSYFNSSIELNVANSPPGLTCTFDKQVLLPNDENSFITFTASYEAEGRYSMTVTGSSEGFVTNGTLLIVVLSPPTPFAVALPQTSTVVQGGSISFQTIIKLAQNGNAFDFPVELGVANLPPGVTCSFSKQTMLPNETSTVSINAAQNATPGQYIVTFTEVSHAFSYNFTDNAVVWLSVEASPSPVWMQTWFWALLGGVAGIMLVSSVGQFYYRKWRRTRAPLDVSYLAVADELSRLEEQRLLGKISLEEYEKSKKDYERKLRGE